MRSRVVGILNLYRYCHAGAALPPTAPKPRAKPLRLGVLAFGVGAVVGSGWAYQEYQKKKNQVAILNDSKDGTFLLSSVPPHKPSRSIKFPMDTSGLKLTLYQYQTCPFCCKVRAMLDYFGVSYDIVEVNPVLRTQLKWSDKYRKVPILIVETPEGEIIQLNDSSMIVSALYSYLNSKSSVQGDNKNDSDLLRLVKCYPMVKYKDEEGSGKSEILNRYFLMYDAIGGVDTLKKEEVLEERKWRRWADSVLVHTLSPNIYRTLPEAIDSFKVFDRVGEWDKNFSEWERYLVIYVGALAMWMIGKRLQRRHNLKKDVRQSLYDECNYWLTQVKKKGKGDFMGGSKPNLADLAVYGVLNSIEGCEAFDDLARNSKVVSDWYRKVQLHLKNPPPKVEISV